MHPSINNSDDEIVPATCHCGIMMHFMSNFSSVSLYRLDAAGRLHETPPSSLYRPLSSYLSSQHVAVTIGHEFQ